MCNAIQIAKYIRADFAFHCMYHTYLTIVVPAVIAFAATIITTKFLMSYFREVGIVAKDYNKKKPLILPTSGGVALSFGLIVGILSYTFGGSFIFTPILSIPYLLAASLSIVLIAFVGLIDDLNVKVVEVESTGRHDIRKGLKQWQKPLLTAIGALPLMAINAGIGVVTLPFIGHVSLGLIYPVVILPLAVIFVANAFNLLGGFDGLQSGMAIVASLGFLLYFLAYGNHLAGSNIGLLLSTLLLASLLAFFPFTKYRAKILPGDSLTYAVGASFIVIMVMGNAEAFGIIIFMPWIIEFLLHIRKRFKVSDLGLLQPDGTLKAPYGKKIYSLTHLMMNIKPMKEWEVSVYLSVLEILFVLLAFGLKFASLM